MVETELILIVADTPEVMQVSIALAHSEVGTDALGLLVELKVNSLHGSGIARLIGSNLVLERMRMLGCDMSVCRTVDVHQWNDSTCSFLAMSSVCVYFCVVVSNN